MTAHTTAHQTNFQKLIEKNHASVSLRRKATNAVMLSVTGLMTILALIPLFWIIGYVVYKGGQYINLDFFIHTPRPLGMEGGGVLNARERSSSPGWLRSSQYRPQSLPHSTPRTIPTHRWVSYCASARMCSQAFHPS